jgi:hypothetical protein
VSERSGPNWLGDLDSHARAYPERLAHARRYFTEMPFDSLTVVKTGPDRFSFIDAEGTEYRTVGHDPLQAAKSQGIVGFTIDDADRLHFLRRRSEGVEPAEEVVLVWSVRAEKVARTTTTSSASATTSGRTTDGTGAGKTAHAPRERISRPASPTVAYGREQDARP